MFLEKLNNELDKFHLLKHPYYQDWSEGKLTIADLQTYAGQYFHHVDAFPRYLSAIHTQCKDLPSRQVLLDNLVDEEKGDENHPELWMQFAEELGCDRNQVRNAKLLAKTEALVDGFFALCNKSYATGLGALYTYERQVPDVAKSKIDGLKKFYDMGSPKALKFFEVHIGADEWHSQEVADLMLKLDAKGKEEAAAGSIAAAKLLWDFLNGIQDYRAVNSLKAVVN